MTLHSIADANQALGRFIGTSPKAGMYKLDSMRQFMAFLGNPQDSYQVVHIAGTSGKTSTSYYVEALGRSLGLKTGLTVSPHIDSIEERAQINGENLPERVYLEYLGEFLDIVDTVVATLSYFEVMVAFAFWVFAKENVQLAVVEVGIGGLLDSTNVISNPEKYCIITDIGLDHIEILGNTLPAIAAQKAGIIGYRNTVFMNTQPTVVQEVISQTAAQTGAHLTVVSQMRELIDRLALPGFQKRNLSVAAAAMEVYAEHIGKRLSDAMIEDVALKTLIPARMERMMFQGRTLILDGAHNGQKMKALVDALLTEYGRNELDVIIAIGTNKISSLDEIFSQLSRLVSDVYLTTFGDEHGAYRASMGVKPMTEAANLAGLKVNGSSEDPLQLLKTVIASGKNDTPLLITGSYYLFNALRPTLLQN